MSDEIPPALIAHNDQLHAAADAELDVLLTELRALIQQRGQLRAAAGLARHLGHVDRQVVDGMLVTALLRLARTRP